MVTQSTTCSPSASKLINENGFAATGSGIKNVLFNLVAVGLPIRWLIKVTRQDTLFTEFFTQRNQFKEARTRNSSHHQYETTVTSADAQSSSERPDAEEQPQTESLSNQKVSSEGSLHSPQPLTASVQVARNGLDQLLNLSETPLLVCNPPAQHHPAAAEPLVSITEDMTESQRENESEIQKAVLDQLHQKKKEEITKPDDSIRTPYSSAEYDYKRKINELERNIQIYREELVRVDATLKEKLDDPNTEGGYKASLCEKAQEKKQALKERIEEEEQEVNRLRDTLTPITGRKLIYDRPAKEFDERLRVVRQHRMHDEAQANAAARREREAKANWLTRLLGSF